MFQFPRLPSAMYVFHGESRGIPRGGLPHSEVPGSRLADSSPGLIAIYYVFHRRPAPEHPPSALPILAAHHSRSRANVRPETLAVCRAVPTPPGDGPDAAFGCQTHTHPNCQGTQGADGGTLAMPIAGASHRVRARHASPDVVEAMGFEPTTPGLQSRCSSTELRPRSPTGPARCAETVAKTGLAAVEPPRKQRAGRVSSTLVGSGRVELPTSSLSGTRSNQLSYEPGGRGEETKTAGRPGVSDAPMYDAGCRHPTKFQESLERR